ncbi:MAG: hypothetical protein KDE54_29350, partial [Caldilineaceae bacterium]|nr:hypothetical protein [Caldilineaceae bacterium]
GAVDLAEPSAGDDFQFSLSQWGAYWLGQDAPQPHDQARRPIQVGEDFRITLALGTPLAERFRVERFAQWQSSYPNYVYQMNQRSLSKAVEGQIAPKQIIDFLERRARVVPEKVISALARFGASTRAVANGIE